MKLNLEPLIGSQSNDAYDVSLLSLFTNDCMNLVKLAPDRALAIKDASQRRSLLYNINMRIIAAVSLFSTLALANLQAPQKHPEDKKEAKQHKLPTFREALYAATCKNQLKEEAPKVIIEVINVREKLVVDERNHTKGYAADMHTAVFAGKSGHLKQIYEQDLKVIPRPESPLLKSIKAQNFIKSEKDKIKKGKDKVENPKAPKKTDKIREILQKIYKKFHLNKRGPALCASIILGFITTAIIYSLVCLMVWVYGKISGYESVRGDDGDVEDGRNKNESDEQLLSREEQRMQESKPLNQ